MRHNKRSGGFHAAPAVARSIRIAVLFLLIALLLYVWLQIDRKLRLPAEKACRYACRSIASEVVADSISQTLSQIDTAALTTAQYDDAGSLTTLQANPSAINQVQALLLDHINTSLQAHADAAFSVELGTLTGIHTLQGRGMSIPMRFLPKGGAEVTLDSQFSSGSLNQIHHRIVANVTLHVGCSVPLYTADETIEVQYLLAETVIMGDLPDYLGVPYREP